ncbi:MAG TPA: beta-ketoacyl-[acyl-carrier-protein] synthase family protein [Candidatus Methylacidiphilales bacterium]
MKRRVVITGMGCITPAGPGVAALRDAVRTGRISVGPLTRFPVPEGCASRWAAQADFFRPETHFSPRELKRLDRYAQFALVAAAEAWADAGLPVRTEADAPDYETGIAFGTALGGVAGAEAHHARFLEKGLAAIPAALAFQVFGASAHANIAIRHRLRGHATTNADSCAAGLVAVGDAFRAIREGYATRMIAGGAEAPLSPLTYASFATIKAMSREESDPARACLPFDRRRTGFVMGEGAAALILEEREAALARNAPIHAEVTGYALNNDAYHMTSSLDDGSAAAEAMTRAIAGAGLVPADIGYVNAHASGTPMNDANEAVAIRRVFGSHRPAVSGTKPFYGHPLGAAGAIETVLCALALKEQTVSPTPGCTEPDPECAAGLDLVRLKPEARPLRHVLNNAFGFGGINASLVLSRA